MDDFVICLLVVIFSDSFDRLLTYSLTVNFVCLGAKLCMILDIIGDSGSVTGVDVARHRLAACRTLLQKYALGDRCRLFVADGTTFSLVPLRLHLDPGSCNELIEPVFCYFIL